jgi:hypothetical protein
MKNLRNKKVSLVKLRESCARAPFLYFSLFSRIDESKLNQASEKTAILSSPRDQLRLAYIFHGSVCCKVKLTKFLEKKGIFSIFLS